MNNNVSDQANIEQEPQISIELDGGVIQLPLSTFNNILEKEITNFIYIRETDEKDIINLNELVNAQCWRSKYNNLELQAEMLQSILYRLKKDLKENKSAQPKRCMAASISQNVNITTNISMANKEDQIYTISDSDDDDDVIIIAEETSKIKPIQTENEIIDLIDVDEDDNTQNLKVEFKPCPESKTNVPIPDLKINDNDKILPINTKASKSLSNGECLSTTIRKRKPGPKSKTMYVDDVTPAENKETVEKKMRLNECVVINNKESNSKSVLNCNSVKKIVAPEKYNHNFLLNPSSLKYPPPFPLIPPHNNQPSWKNVPPIPNMTIKTSGNKVILTWDLNLTWQTAKIKLYELFVCQETDEPPKSSMWKKKGSIKADLLPMACELEVFDLGHIYHFALRAVDVHSRRAPFALQKAKI